MTYNVFGRTLNLAQSMLAQSILTPNKLIFTSGGSYVCANFGENRLRNATVRVLADGQTH